MGVIEFPIVGVPEAQPRQKHAVYKTKSGGFSSRNYDPGTKQGWKGFVIAAAMPFVPREPLQGVIRCDIWLFFPRDAWASRKIRRSKWLARPKKPDRDNCDKLILDTLSKMGFWNDDNQVCFGAVEKYQAAFGKRTGAVVRIESFNVETNFDSCEVRRVSEILNGPLRYEIR